MPKSLPYGFWTFGGRNGLEGSASTVRDLPDGRVQTVPDPDFPAVLPDEQIVYALRHSPPARSQFYALFPNLDPRSQQRLLDLIDSNKACMKSVRTDQEFLDRIQHRDVVSSVPLRNLLSYKG